MGVVRGRLGGAFCRVPVGCGGEGEGRVGCGGLGEKAFAAVEAGGGGWVG